MKTNQNCQAGIFENTRPWETGLNLQFFAAVGWDEIAEPKRDENGNIIGFGKPVFTAATGEDLGEAEYDVEETEIGDSEDEAEEPIYMPRLTLTPQNIPQLAEGEMVVLDEDGNLMAASVDEEGEVTLTQISIEEDNIADGAVSAMKIQENAITPRELDMEALFADSALLNQMLSANIDPEALFENNAFVERLGDHTDGYLLSQAFAERQFQTDAGEEEPVSPFVKQLSLYLLSALRIQALNQKLAGLPELAGRVNQDVKTNANPTFGNIAANVVTANKVIGAVYA